MSSGAIVQALLADDVVRDYVGSEGVYSDYALDTPPRNDFFIILRWGNQSYRREVRNGPVFLNLWAHQPEEMGNDYTDINNLLEACRQVLEGMEHVIGADDIRVTNAIFTGHGGNVYDPGFRTYARSSSYNVLLRMV